MADPRSLTCALCPLLFTCELEARPPKSKLGKLALVTLGFPTIAVGAVVLASPAGEPIMQLVDKLVGTGKAGRAANKR